LTKRSRKALIIGAACAGPVTAILLKQAGFVRCGLRGLSLFDRHRRRLADRAETACMYWRRFGLAAELMRGGSICESITTFYSQSGAPSLGQPHMAQRISASPR